MIVTPFLGLLQTFTGDMFVGNMDVLVEFHNTVEQKLDCGQMNLR